MKKFPLLTALGAVGALTTNGASAATCSSYGVTAGAACDGRNSVPYAVDCMTGVSSSGTCKYIDCSEGCVCAQSCPTCPTECNSSTTWKLILAKPGYEGKCNKSGGPVSYKCDYRCAAGYYGTANIYGAAGCTQGPSWGGVAGQRVAGDNSTITKCYIPSGSSFSDSAGSGTYTADCYWTE